MNKRLFLFTVLMTIFISGIFAQSNWISFDIKGPGAGLRYEYVISPNITLGGYVSYTFLAIPLFDTQYNSFEFGATFRWYPFARRFFTELNIGYNFFEYYKSQGSSPSIGGSTGDFLGNVSFASFDHSDSTLTEASGFCISPGFGWTIDVGRIGGFFLSPGVKFPITISEQFNITIAPYFGLGLAF